MIFTGLCCVHVGRSTWTLKLIRASHSKVSYLPKQASFCAPHSLHSQSMNMTLYYYTFIPLEGVIARPLKILGSGLLHSRRIPHRAGRCMKRCVSTCALKNFITLCKYEETEARWTALNDSCVPLKLQPETLSSLLLFGADMSKAGKDPDPLSESLDEQILMERRPGFLSSPSPDFEEDPVPEEATRAETHDDPSAPEPAETIPPQVTPEAVLRGPQPPAQLPSGYVVVGSSARPEHPVRTDICGHWKRSEGCQEEVCAFAHGASRLVRYISKDAPVHNRLAGPRTCLDYLKARCVRGEWCAFAHSCLPGETVTPETKSPQKDRPPQGTAQSSQGWNWTGGWRWQGATWAGGWEQGQWETSQKRQRDYPEQDRRDEEYQSDEYLREETTQHIPEGIPAPPTEPVPEGCELVYSAQRGWFLVELSAELLPREYPRVLRQMTLLHLRNHTTQALQRRAIGVHPTTSRLYARFSLNVTMVGRVIDYLHEDGHCRTPLENWALKELFRDGLLMAQARDSLAALDARGRKGTLITTYRGEYQEAEPEPEIKRQKILEPKAKKMQDVTALNCPRARSPPQSIATYAQALHREPETVFRTESQGDYLLFREWPLPEVPILTQYPVPTVQSTQAALRKLASPRTASSASGARGKQVSFWLMLVFIALCGTSTEAMRATSHASHDTLPHVAMSDATSQRRLNEENSRLPHVHAAANAITIYTDGAYKDNNSAWCFVVHETGKQPFVRQGPVITDAAHPFAYIGATVHGVLEAEASAMIYALLFVISYVHHDVHVTLITDSRNAKMIAEGKYNCTNKATLTKTLRATLLRARTTHKVKIDWNPSHVGIAGNEQADQGAGQALRGQYRLEHTCVEGAEAVQELGLEVKRLHSVEVVQAIVNGTLYSAVNSLLPEIMQDLSDREMDQVDRDAVCVLLRKRAVEWTRDERRLYERVYRLLKRPAGSWTRVVPLAEHKLPNTVPAELVPVPDSDEEEQAALLATADVIEAELRERVQPQPPLQPAATTAPAPPQTNPSTPLRIVVYDVCSGIGTAREAFLIAVERLRLTRFELSLEFFCYEIDTYSYSLYLHTHSPKYKHTLRGDISNLPNDLASHPDDYIAVVLAGTPCEKISRGTLRSQNPAARVGVHASPSNLAFKVHEGVRELRAKGRDYVQVCEMVVPYSEQEEHTLKRIWGPMLPLPCARFGGATRDRRVFCYPPVHPLDITYQKLTQPYSLSGGYQWPLPKYASLTSPPCIRAIIPRLYERKLEGKTDESENRQLDQMTVYHFDKGSRMPCPEHIAQWMAYPVEYTRKLLETQQCEGLTSPLTSLSHQQAQRFQGTENIMRSFKPCGVEKYCSTCADVIERMGRSWHVAAMSEVIIVSLAKKLHAMHSGTPLPPHDVVDDVHFCSTQCMFSVPIEQARATQRRGW